MNVKGYLFFISFWVFSNAKSQHLVNISLSDHEKKKGILAIYSYHNREDGGITLVLYKGNRYHYSMATTGYDAFSKGKWYRRGNKLTLISDFDFTNIPVQIKYIDEIDSKTNYRRTQFQVPVNMKSEPLSNSEIFINNDTTFCFPFFDTCVGIYKRIDSIKVDFGDNYKSKWIKLNANTEKKVMLVAQVDFLFSSYLVFRNQRYKIVKGILMEIK